MSAAMQWQEELQLQSVRQHCYKVPRQLVRRLVHLEDGVRTFPIKWHQMGIYLTQVTTTCSVSGCGRVSARSTGAGAPLFDRGSLPGVFVSTSLAGRILLPTLRESEGMAGLGFAVGMHGLSSPGFSDLGNDFSGQPTASDSMVSGGVVGHQPEERRQRHGLTAGAGLEELQDGLDFAA